MPGVYILQSLKNNRYYIGSTDNSADRLEQHNRGLVKSTRFLIPLISKSFIQCMTIKEARQAEYRLKRYKSKKIIEKVIKDSKLPWLH